jgi:hypothetical protein
LRAFLLQFLIFLAPASLPRYVNPESRIQTPHDQDATYRSKKKKDYIGFVGNMIEICDGDKNLITGYDLQKIHTTT